MAILTSERWARRVVQVGWLPTDVCTRMLAVTRDVLGEVFMSPEDTTQYDAVRVRYELNGYYLQLTQTTYAITVAIRSGQPVEPRPATLEEQTQLAADTIAAFLNVPDDFLTAAETSADAVGTLTRGSTRYPRLGDMWYERSTWWTDGQTVALLSPKYASGRIVMIADWFASNQRWLESVSGE